MHQPHDRMPLCWMEHLQGPSPCPSMGLDQINLGIVLFMIVFKFPFSHPPSCFVTSSVNTHSGSLPQWSVVLEVRRIA